MTRDDERRKILENLKLGLVRFWIAKGTTDEVTINVPTPENEEEKVEEKVEVSIPFAPEPIPGKGGRRST